MNELRWILLGAGIALVVAVLIWGHLRKKSRPPSAFDDKYDVPSFSVTDTDKAWKDGVGPVKVVSPRRGTKTPQLDVTDIPPVSIAAKDESLQPQAWAPVSTPAPEAETIQAAPVDHTSMDNASIDQTSMDHAPMDQPLAEQQSATDDAMDYQAEERPAEENLDAENLDAENWTAEDLAGGDHSGQAPTSDDQTQEYQAQEDQAQGDQAQEDQAGDDQVSTDDVIALYVIAQSGELLKGEQILGAAIALDLEYGEMKIFHRRDEQQQIAFSMVNIMEPGWFDYDTMHELKTRGVSFFLQLSLCAQPTQALDDMLVCAHNMANMLGAQLCDQEKQKLNETYTRALRAKAKHYAEQKQV